MKAVETISVLNVPDLFGLADSGLDDADVDAHGNLFVSDGINGRVYRLNSDGSFDALSVIRPGVTGERESGLNLAVAPDSSFYLADTVSETVVRYNENGSFTGEFSAPGVLSLCCGPDGLIYLLSSVEGVPQINAYDQLGGLVTDLPAPARHRAHLDSGLANLDADPDGNIYVSYGMPPYRIWKVAADGSDVAAWSTDVDYMEDAVLIADIALDRTSGVLWVLLACKMFGLQRLDCFSPEGEFLGTAGIPHSDVLYSVICSSPESGLFLLDTGAGDLLCAAVSS